MESDANHMHADGELLCVEDNLLAELSDQDLEEELTMIDMEAEGVDSDLLDHRDSYQIQLKKSKELKTSNNSLLEGVQTDEVLTLGDGCLDIEQEIDIENTDQLVTLEQKNSVDLPQSDVVEETECVVTTSETICDDSSLADKLTLVQHTETEQTEADSKEEGEETNETQSMEDLMEDGTGSATPSASVATVLDLQRSTASDLVSKVMQKAIEEASSSQLEVAMDTTP